MGNIRILNLALLSCLSQDFGCLSHLVRERGYHQAGNIALVFYEAYVQLVPEYVLLLEIILRSVTQPQEPLATCTPWKSKTACALPHPSFSLKRTVDRARYHCSYLA